MAMVAGTPIALICPMLLSEGLRIDSGSGEAAAPTI
jgi:hypothetical protein